MEQKKSQITIFLILGAVIVITIAMLVVATRYSTKKTSKQEIIDSKEIVFNVHPINNFIGSCLSIVSKDALNKTFGNPPIKEKLEEYVKNNIDLCLDFSIFEEQGLDISRYVSSVDVSINKNDVVFRMTHPITINNPINNEKTIIKDFLVKHEVSQEGT